MRAGLLALFLAASCAAPGPCTRTLCVSKLEGSMETRAWSGVVISTAGSPQPPVPSDAEVAVLSGSVEFRHRKARVLASEGAVFRFSVSTKTAASIAVGAGTVSVGLSTAAAPVPVPPGTSFVFPKK